ATYVTGWIKRGPVGLIGHTKGDANETIACLLEDRETFDGATDPDPQSVLEFLRSKDVLYTTWDGWHRLDTYERALGEPEGRERVKVVERADMLRASLG
ncbi:pyridine nucleotide-disulfide oxidoreductase, partial [Nocardia xishanensis]